MYSISVKNVKKGKKLFIIFLVAGIFFLIVVGGILVSNHLALNSLDSTTTSTRVEIKSFIDDEGKTMYSPVYYYMVNNNEYACGSNASSNLKPGTANQTVYYDSKNPEKCMSEYSKSSNLWMMCSLLIPIVFIAIAVFKIRKINKRVASIEKLNHNGKLIKNLPYHLENSGTVINGVPILCPVVEYTLPSGSTISLRGDPRLDKNPINREGTVDLVIDENNPNNYFIDFEIDRLSGNLPTDYYQQPSSKPQDATDDSQQAPSSTV